MLLFYFYRRRMQSEIIPIILACISPLVTLLIYQWKVMSETRKTLNAMGLLIYDRTVLKKLFLHLVMDDPQASAKERRMLEKRISRIEDIIKLLASKNRLQKLIDAKISSINDGEEYLLKGN